MTKLASRARLASICAIALLICQPLMGVAQTIPITLPAVPPQTGNQLSQSPRVQVRGFKFEGNTAFSADQLAAIAEPFRKAHDGWMSSEDLESVRTVITLAYVNAGYINSGAVLPDQNVDDGIIRYKIIEGRLTKIHVHHGNPAAMMNMLAPATQPVAAAPGPAAPNAVQREAAGPLPHPHESEPWHLLSDDYVTSRVLLGSAQPLNILSLKDELELLRRDPNVKTINAELSPGEESGEASLDLAVTERNPFQLGVEFANTRAPAVGGYEMDILASDSDLTGHGDDLSLRYGVLAGAANTLEYNQDHDYSIDYLIPLTARDLTLELNYTRSTDAVVQEPFTSVDINSKTDSIYATFRQPLVHTVEDPQLHTRDQELAAFFTVSSRYNRTFLLGEPASFSDGADNGKQDVFALRPGLDYVRQSTDDALAVRGTLSIGIDGSGSTLHDNGVPDSRFVAFLGQAQYIHRFPLGDLDQPWNDTQGVLRFNTQLTPDQLLTLEQFSLGGISTVRGYEENQVVRDMAATASAELQVPVFKANQQDILTLVPFFDAGYGWNRQNASDPPEFLDSVGAGMVFTPNSQVKASIYYGYRLKQFSHDEDDLQDMGIQFDVTVLAF